MQHKHIPLRRSQRIYWYGDCVLSFQFAFSGSGSFAVVLNMHSEKIFARGIIKKSDKQAKKDEPRRDLW
jgi:hypothetical protein